MKKIIAFILLGTLAAATLAGCGEAVTDPPATSSTPLSSTASTPVSETSSVASESESSTELNHITLTTDEKQYQGDFVGQFPKITGADTETIRTINAEVQKLQDQFEAAESAADGEGHTWLECKSYSTSNDKYLNIVLNWNEFPTYGTQGDVYGYTYDLEKDQLVSVTDALAEQNLTEDDLKASLAEFLSEGEYTKYREITEFQVAACRLGDDGSAEFILMATLDDGPETPEERVTQQSKELFIYSTATESTVNFNR